LAVRPAIHFVVDPLEVGADGFDFFVEPSFVGSPPLQQRATPQLLDVRPGRDRSLDSDHLIEVQRLVERDTNLLPRDFGARLINSGGRVIPERSGVVKWLSRSESGTVGLWWAANRGWLAWERTRASDDPGSRWSARSGARTYDLDAGEERRILRSGSQSRRWFSSLVS
jgi:hypothetical protein